MNLDTPLLKMENVINLSGRIKPAYTNIQNDIRRAGFKTYTKGYDSIAIRLFYDYNNPEFEIVEMRKNCEDWVFLYFKLRRHIGNEEIKVDIIKQKIIIPQSGWKDFTNKIFDLGIATLPDYSYIPEYNAANNGYSLTVEISMSKYYRIYTYLGPKQNLI